MTRLTTALLILLLLSLLATIITGGLFVYRLFEIEMTERNPDFSMEAPLTPTGYCNYDGRDNRLVWFDPSRVINGEGIVLSFAPEYRDAEYELWIAIAAATRCETRGNVRFVVMW